MTEEDRKLAMEERNSLATLTSIAELSQKLRAYFGELYGNPEQLVEQVNEIGWRALRKRIPGFGRVYQARLEETLRAAGYTVH